jgi:hypothetical protein
MIPVAVERRSLLNRIPPVGRRCARSGTALLEGTIVLTVFLLIIFAMFDLGLAVMRQNSLAESARRLARTAIVHGDLATPEYTSWGPLQYSATADDDHEIANAVRTGLITMNPADVAIEVTWPDGDNRSGDRVIVSLEYPHRTILPSLFGGSSLNLRAESTMRVEH